jgi:hypothetical protein
MQTYLNGSYGDTCMSVLYALPIKLKEKNPVEKPPLAWVPALEIVGDKKGGKY